METKMLRISIIVALLAAYSGQSVAEFADSDGNPIHPLTLNSQRTITLPLETNRYPALLPVNSARQEHLNRLLSMPGDRGGDVLSDENSGSTEGLGGQ
jgi:hypothetical protein